MEGPKQKEIKRFLSGAIEHCLKLNAILSLFSFVINVFADNRVAMMFAVLPQLNKLTTELLSFFGCRHVAVDRYSHAVALNGGPPIAKGGFAQSKNGEFGFETSERSKNTKRLC
jgi:hypothetical protein